MEKMANAVEALIQGLFVLLSLGLMIFAMTTLVVIEPEPSSKAGENQRSAQLRCYLDLSRINSSHLAMFLLTASLIGKVLSMQSARVARIGKSIPNKISK